jgi:hypothetical protein
MGCSPFAAVRRNVRLDEGALTSRISGDEVAPITRRHRGWTSDRSIRFWALGLGFSESGKFGANVVQDRPVEGSEGVVWVERGMAGRDDEECTGARCHWLAQKV